MTKDYKPKQTVAAGRGSAFFIGWLIGLLCGVGLALAFIMFVKKSDNPFTDTPNINAEEIVAKSPAKKPQKPADPAKTEEDSAKDFDFYTVLPENEKSVSEQEVNQLPAPVKEDNYFLQVGSFQDEADADNMKAKLALQGFEAIIQTAEIPDRGVWHRVRVGPLSDREQINKMRQELNQNGFSPTLIKVHSETKP